MSLIDDFRSWLSGSGSGYQALKVTDVTASQQTSYGVQEVVSNKTFIRSAPVYNLVPANFRMFSSTGGSAASVTGTLVWREET